MTTARQTAKKLREFLNHEGLTLSDLRKGMIHLLNGTLGDIPGDGKVRVEGRKPGRNDSRAPQPTTRMNIDDAACFS